jgi:hypothetical protein
MTVYFFSFINLPKAALVLICLVYGKSGFLPFILNTKVITLNFPSELKVYIYINYFNNGKKLCIALLVWAPMHEKLNFFLYKTIFN